MWTQLGKMSTGKQNQTSWAGNYTHTHKKKIKIKQEVTHSDRDEHWGRKINQNTRD